VVQKVAGGFAKITSTRNCDLLYHLYLSAALVMMESSNAFVDLISVTDICQTIYEKLNADARKALWRTSLDVRAQVNTALALSRL
jgi:hypothetical protein